MRNVQSRRGSTAVLGVLVMVAGIVFVTILRDVDSEQRRFDIACHTPGQVSNRCAEVFTDVPLCTVEDCSDVWPKAGYFIDEGTGIMQFQVPDTPIRDASQKAG